MSCSGRKPVFWLSLLPSTPAPSLLCPADQGCRHTKQSDNEDHAVQVLGAIKKNSMIAVSMMMVEMIIIMSRWAGGSCAGDWPNNRHWFPIQYTGLEHTEVIIITTAIIIVITIISIIILIITISLRIITAKISNCNQLREALTMPFVWHQSYSIHSSKSALSNTLQKSRNKPAKEKSALKLEIHCTLYWRHNWRMQNMNIQGGGRWHNGTYESLLTQHSMTHK